MRIALLDLNHATRGVHNNTAPLGLGMLARYLGKTVDNGFDIRLFKDTDKALEALDSWRPDVAGIAQYSWNSELNLYAAALAKEYNPECLVIAGGPNLGVLNEEKRGYFKAHPFIDACVSYDGEIPFAITIGRLLKGESIDSIRMHPPAGIYTYDSSSGTVIDSSEAPPRLNSLDIFGSLYADGVFDEFLDDGFNPFLQTHRGCPFTCAFCHTSDRYYSHMLFLSPDIFRCDMEYLGRRFEGRHDVTLYLANTNMSLFKEDFAIARIIRDIQKKYDWPRLINVNSGKDPKKLLKMMSIISFNPGIALQTLTPVVLKNINRVNIALEDFASFQRAILRKTGEPSGTELILCLPGETMSSFLETLKKVLNSGAQEICVYTLMALKGTPLSSRKNSDKYGYVIRHRVVPRQFSLARGKKILDTEEVIVGTDTMSFDDYIELRKLCFTVSVFFSSIELIPLKKFLLEHGVDIAEWIFGIHRRLSELPDISRYYKEFTRETKDELFPTRKALIGFYGKAKNWKALCEGRYGDNLLRKYKQLALYHSFKSVLKLALSEAGKLLNEENAALALGDMERYLSTRDVKAIFGKGALTGDREVRLDYDIHSWLSNQDGALSFEDFHSARAYKVAFNLDVKEKAKKFIAMNKDAELSLQILYRDGGIRDFWPQWVALKKRKTNQLYGKIPAEKIH